MTSAAGADVSVEGLGSVALGAAVTGAGRLLLHPHVKNSLRPMLDMKKRMAKSYLVPAPLTSAELSCPVASKPVLPIRSCPSRSSVLPLPVLTVPGLDRPRKTTGLAGLDRPRKTTWSSSQARASGNDEGRADRAIEIATELATARFLDR
jgi:hypothetical protein